MDKKPDTNNSQMARWIALGLALGVAIGVALDNIAIGIGVGIALGAGIGSAWERQQAKKSGPDEKEEES